MATTGVLEAFNAARQEFLRDLPDSEKIKFSTFQSAEDVYDATDRIQREQGTSQSLRNLRKIQPYLGCLSHYASVIETFVQVKPEILALIWSGVQISSTYVKSYDKILDCMSQLGESLPHFENYAQLFEKNATIKHVLCLFYRDILDFHATVIHFFGKKKWRIFFESIWPRYAGKIAVIRQNMERHRLLLDSEVTLAHISESHTARLQALKAYEEAYEFQQRQDFASTKSSLHPELYDQELERISEGCISRTGRWLTNNFAFQAWSDPQDVAHRVLWIEGIPGAGKTYLSSRIVQDLKSANSQVVFAFLSYRSSQRTSTLGILQSFIFQFVYENPTLRHILCQAVETKQRQLASSVESNRELFKNLVEDISVSIIVDGLDEISESERGSVLKTLLSLLDDCPNLRLLISSRGEHDILKALKCHAEIIRLHSQNGQDIKAYVAQRVDGWLLTLKLDKSMISQIRQLLRSVAKRAKGMFLYARLVLDNIESQSNLDHVRHEASNLPDGLDEAYGRIIERIDNRLRLREQKEARTILSWVACSNFPFTKEEIQFAVSMSNGVNPSKANHESFLNIIQRCGPIIEIFEGVVQFVHFTAKEYLFNEQSGHYLQEAECNKSIALTCIHYLSSHCFDLGISEDDVKEYILSGAYVLESYACGLWLHHVKKAVELRTELLDSTLCNKLLEFVDKRANPNFVRSLMPRGDHDTTLKLFEEDWPILYEIFRDIDFFLFRRQRDLCLSSVSSENGNKSDPLTVSATEAQHFQILNSMLCASQNHRKDCLCASLRRIYGLRVFNLNTHHSMIHGIKTGSNANSGSKSPVGKGTETLNGTGTANSFQPQETTAVASGNTSVSTTRMPELERLLVKSVKSNNFDYIHEYWHEVPKYLRKLLRASIVYSSIDMLELLLKTCSNVSDIDKYILNFAAKYNNLQAAHRVLEKGAKTWDSNSRHHHSDLHCAISNRSPAMIELLLAHGCRDVADGFQKLLPAPRDKAAEEAAMQCFTLLEDAHLLPWKQQIRSCFKGNAAKSFSIPIAQFLLRHGADINAFDTPGYTALYFASENESQKAAKFMKFLLQAGAKSPSVTGRQLPIEERPGPRNISRWLGMTWDELVDEYKSDDSTTSEEQESWDL
ncbi:MAG: hypothetical protein M1822_005700 [Bathelium mastoideum]|nr:MAG: hypothetical protein M1822_005700 [Bathelium mastoideum]